MTYFAEGSYLPRAGARHWQALAHLHGCPLDELERLPIDLRRAEFHPAGERRVSEAELLGWREELNSWAYDWGYPGKLNEARRSEWDVQLGLRLLADTRGLPEAQHPNVWCWVATNLMPHFGVYRWGWPAKQGDDSPTGRTPWARFGPSDRNGLLLVRQRIQTYGPELTQLATEQELQSIQYRPAFGLDQRVAQVVLAALVFAWEDPGSNYGKNGGTRALDADDVCIEVRLINSLRPLCFATDDEIVAIVTDAIARLPSYRKPSNQRADESVPTSG